MKGISFDRFMMGLLFAAVGLTACLMPAQSDTYWHLRAGQDIWISHQVPLVEHYSLTAGGRFWPNHEWLWQAISYAFYRVGGMPLLYGRRGADHRRGLRAHLPAHGGRGDDALRVARPGCSDPGACVWALRAADRGASRCSRCS